jgi:hypothetical protein
MPEVHHLVGAIGALGLLDEHAMFTESLEDHMNMLQVGAP